jgi:hypothetical protein
MAPLCGAAAAAVQGSTTLAAVKRAECNLPLLLLMQDVAYLGLFSFTVSMEIIVRNQQETSDWA